jgi:MFS family permease
MADKDLDPPAFIRRLVRTLGAGPGNRTVTFEVLIFLSAVALGWLLSRKPADFWADLHPALGAQSVREALFLVASTVVFFVCVRSWATEQRRRLEPAAVKQGSDFGLFVFLLAFAAFMGMMLSDLLGYGLLPGVIIGAALVILGAVAPWRGRILDILFGKRASSTGNAE